MKRKIKHFLAAYREKFDIQSKNKQGKKYFITYNKELISTKLQKL